MGLGDILGSISPAYGAVAGKGLGGMAVQMSPLQMLLHSIGKGMGGAQPEGAPAEAPQGLGAKLGSALQQGGDFHSGAGMQFAQAPQQGGGLSAILAALGMSL